MYSCLGVNSLKVPCGYNCNCTDLLDSAAKMIHGTIVPPSSIAVVLESLKKNVFQGPSCS